MRILHTADWHLGKRLENFSRLEEQKEVLEEICRIADDQKVEVVLVAGDLFDAYNPPVEAVDLFYKTVKKLSNNGKRAVIAIAGNHDSPERIEAPDPLAKECGIIFVGYPNSKVGPCELESGLCVCQSEEGFIELKLPGTAVPLRLILTPYANELRLKTYLGVENQEEELRKILADRWQYLANKYCDNKGINILMAHLYMMKKGGEAPEEPEEEKPILHVGAAQEIYTESIPEQMQYVALGHLHRWQTVDKNPCPVVYSSSPLAYSFSEANQEKYVVVFDAEPRKKITYNGIKLTKGKKLFRKKFNTINEAVEWLTDNPNTLVELTIVTDKFLSSEDRKLLNEAHAGIVTIIPEVKNQEYLDSVSCHKVDLGKEMNELFAEYFKFRQGQSPNEKLMKLFKEIQAEDGNREE